MKKILSYILISVIYSTEYYVSSLGDSLNTGTFDSPFLHIQQAADIIEAGDICYIRQGVYAENITIDNKDGSEGAPIVFTSYNDERVVFDGTTLIETEWIPYVDLLFNHQIVKHFLPDSRSRQIGANQKFCCPPA